LPGMTHVKTTPILAREKYHNVADSGGNPPSERVPREVDVEQPGAREPVGNLPGDPAVVGKDEHLEARRVG